MKDRVRVAAVQYYIRPVAGFEQFEEQVRGLVMTAKDYHCDLIVFPEYFTLQLLTTIEQRDRPIDRQIRALAGYEQRIVELFRDLATSHGMYIVGGTLPAVDPPNLETMYNECYIYAPDGDWEVQGKLYMTRFEKEEFFVTPHRKLRVFDTALGKMAVTICYDVEFPEIARAAARAGADILVVPSCTDERYGYLRVRYCAHARAIENQMYVIHSPTVGSLPMIPAVSLNYGAAAILTPSDFSFARDGILAEGNINQEMIVIADLNMQTIGESREKGTVLPLYDSRTTAQVTAELETVEL